MGSNLSDKTVIITGGASGIGAATTRHIAATYPGSHITILDVQDSAGEALAASLNEETQSHVQFIHSDIGSWEEQASAFRRTVESSPSKNLDVVICCAGIQEGSELIKNVLAAEKPSSTSTSLSDNPQLSAPPSKAIDVNLTGQYYTAWLACYYFRLNNSSENNGQSKIKTKSLVLVASLAGYASFPNTSTTYWMSKWGLRGLFHSIRYDVEKVGARVNLIAPYWVKTPLVRTFQSTDTPPGGWTDMQDVVAAIVDCARDEKIDGRSLAIFPPPIKRADMEDNMEGAFGGEVARRLTSRLLPSPAKP